MARPTLITIQGTYLKPDGTPESGTVTFRSEISVLSSATETVMAPGPVRATLDETGSFSVEIPATNDPAWSPEGWTYVFHAKLSQSSLHFHVMVPYDVAGGILYLSQMLPSLNSNGNLYAPINHTHDGMGGGGGAVTSVAGRTGAVVLTKSDVGLANVDNTSDANKPVSTATQTALNGKASTTHSHAAGDISSGTLAIGRIPTGTSGTTVALGNDSRFSDARTPTAHAASHAAAGTDPLTISQSQVTNLTTALAAKADTSSLATVATSGSYTDLTDKPTIPTVPVTSVAGKTGDVTLAKADVGLGNVDNTSDASKPVSTATQTALNGKANSTHSHAISDVTNLQTSLDGKASSTHSHAISDVTNLQTSLDAKAPTASPTFTGTVSGVTKAHVGLGNVDNTSDSTKNSATATLTNKTLDSPAFTGTPTGLTKSHVGLANVDNTSDANKPVSTATQTALNGKPDVYVWSGSAYVLSTTGDIYIGPNDPGSVGDGSVWIDTTP